MTSFWLRVEYFPRLYLPADRQKAVVEALERRWWKTAIFGVLAEFGRRLWPASGSDRQKVVVEESGDASVRR